MSHPTSNLVAEAMAAAHQYIFKMEWRDDEAHKRAIEICGALTKAIHALPDFRRRNVADYFDSFWRQIIPIWIGLGRPDETDISIGRAVFEQAERIYSGAHETPATFASQTVTALLMAARSSLRQARCPECSRNGMQGGAGCHWCLERVALMDSILNAPSDETKPPQWRPISTAPRDGSHFLGAHLHPSAPGFGIFDGVHVPLQTVVHWWHAEGEEGFYTSVNERAPECPLQLTHWMPLPASSVKTNCSVSAPRDLEDGVDELDPLT